MTDHGAINYGTTNLMALYGAKNDGSFTLTQVETGNIPESMVEWFSFRQSVRQFINKLKGWRDSNEQAAYI